MSPANQILVTVALVVVIFVGLLVGDSLITAKCFDFWPFQGKACVISTK